MYRKGLFAAFLALVSMLSLQAQITANFTAAQTTGCAPNPLNVSITNTSTAPGGISTSNWAVFDQGGTQVFSASITNPTFSFTIPGRYSVRLVVTGPNGVDTLLQPDFIELFAAPVPDFTLSTAEGCAPLTLQLQNTSTANATGYNSIDWTFNPGNIPAASGANPTITASQTGTYDINLIVVNNNGCQAFKTVTGALTVHPPSTASFTSPDNTACIAPHTVNFSSNVAVNNPLTGDCSWSFPGGSPSSFTGCTPPAVQYAASGNYAVTLTLTSTEPSCTVVVTDPAFVSIGSINSDFSVPALVCEGQTATFSAATPSSGVFQWDFENDGIYDATGTSVNHIYPAADTFTVKLRVNKGPGCMDSTIKADVIIVHPTPVADFALLGSNSSCTVPATFIFSDSSEGATTYAWSFGAQGNPQNSAAASPSVTYNAFGQYQATLTVSNTFGCSETQTQALNVSAPQVNFTSSAQGGCLPINLTFQDASTANEPIVAWEWVFGDGTGTDGIAPGTSTAQNPATTLTEQGAYDVRLIITTLSGCKDTLFQNDLVRGDTLPLVDFAPFNIPVCARDTTFFNSLHLAPEWTYEWDFEFDPQSGFVTRTTGANANYVWTDTGSFSIALSVTNNTCEDTLIRLNTITVNSPVAKFVVDVPVLCGLPATVTLTDSTIQPATLWEWYMDDVLFLSSATSTNPTFTFFNQADLGTHVIKLKVFNSVSGCVDSTEHTVSVGDPAAGFATANVFGCRAFTAAFTNSSTDAVAYQWFSNGSVFSSAATPTLTLPDSGRYSIRLIAIDAFGCLDTADQANLIHVVGPYAKFTSPVVAGCAPLTTSFQDQSVTSSGATLTNWLWNFNDPNATGANPNTSVLQNPSHTYDASGSYAVKLVITDSFGCEDSVTRSNFIRPTFPVPDFTVADDSTCAGTNAPGVVFTNTSSGVSLQYVWDFGDGNGAFTASPTHVYTPATPVTTALQFTVKLIATDVNGCIDSVEKPNFITIEPFQALFNADNTFSDCPPLTVNFTDSASLGNIASYQWVFGDGGFSSITDPSHTYLLPDEYDVTLTVTHVDGCIDSLVMPGFINVDGPRGTFSISPQIACPLEPITFTINVERTDSVTIVYGDGTFDTMGGLNPGADQAVFTHAYVNPGILPVTVTGSLVSCGRVIAQGSVEVSTPPVAAFAVSDTTPCEDAAFTLTDMTTAGSVPLFSWNWDLGDATTSAAQNPSHTYSQPGAKTVTLVVADNRLCKDTATLVITPQERPNAAFIPSDTVGCAPKTVTFTDQSDAGDAPLSSWTWNFGGGTGNTTLQNPSATFSANTTYTISLIVGDQSGCTDTLTQSQLLRLRVPTAQVTISSQRFCENAEVTLYGTTSVTDTPLVQYDWLLSNTTAGTSQAATTTADSLKTVITPFGAYTVRLVVTDVLGCTDTVTVPAMFQAAEPPTAAINLPVVSGCQPFSISPQDISTPGTNPSGGPVISRFWDFGVATSTSDTSSLQAPSFTYTDPGTYPLTLSVTDSLGCSDTTTLTVTVFRKPTADFVSADTVDCAPHLASFTDLSSGDVAMNQWTWQFGNGGVSFVQNPVANYANDGNFTVTLFVRDQNGCRDTVEKTAYVRLDHPDAVLDLDRNIGCDYDSITFLATGSTAQVPITNYAWVIVDQEGNIIHTASVDSFLFAFSDTGTYIISLQVTDAKGCTDTDQDTLSIIKKRTPDPIELKWVSVTGDQSIQVNFRRHPETDFFRYYIYRDSVLTDSVITNRSDTLYTDLVEGTDITHCYKIQVLNICGLSSDIALTDRHCTVTNTATPATDQIDLAWNAYVGWPAKEYQVYRVSDYSTPLVTPLDTIDAAGPLVYQDTGTFCRDTIRYRIVAVKADTDTVNVIVSASNIAGEAPVHVSPTQPHHLTVVTVASDSLAILRWPRYTGYKPSHYVIERSRDGKEWQVIQASLPFTQIQYTDNTTLVQQQPVYYRVTAVDSCGENAPLGRIGRTIYLEAEMKTSVEVIRLTWTPYLQWVNGVSSYSIYIFDEFGAPQLVGTVDGSITTFSHDFTKNPFPNLSHFCYVVVADQANGNAQSASNTACVVRAPKVVAPNAFTPNEDGDNDVFALADFGTVETWVMHIYDRWGHEVTELTQNDGGWDGSYGKGNKTAQAPEGVYLYSWTGIGFDGAVVTLNGQITLIR